MSQVAACPLDSRWGTLPGITDAVSEFSRGVLGKFSQAFSAATPSVTEHRLVDGPMDALASAFLDAKAEATENTEQVAPTLGSLKEAAKLLTMLPPGITPPEIVVEPSGAIALVWDDDEKGFLVLAVNGQAQIQRSAVIDGREISGREPLAEELSAAAFAVLRAFRVVHAAA